MAILAARRRKGHPSGWKKRSDHPAKLIDETRKKCCYDSDNRDFVSWVLLCVAYLCFGLCSANAISHQSALRQSESRFLEFRHAALVGGPYPSAACTCRKRLGLKPEKIPSGKCTPLDVANVTPPGRESTPPNSDRNCPKRKDSPHRHSGLRTATRQRRPDGRRASHRC